jgi:hypothetical protein
MTKRTGRPPLTRRRALPRAAELLAALPPAAQTYAAERCPDGDAIDRYLVATHAELTMVQQAERLAVHRTAVNKWRIILAGRGLIRPDERAGQRPISLAESTAIARLFRSGLPATAIASAREISLARVNRVLLRAGAAPYAPRAAPLSATGVSAIFGVHRCIPQGWARRGWLPDLRHRSYRGVRHAWTRGDLVEFVRNRETWIAWDVAQITDAELRQVAARARREAGGAWYQQEEIAALLGVKATNFCYWLSEAPLLARLTMQAYSGGRYYWLSDADRDALEHQGDALERARIAGRSRHASAELRAWLLATFGPLERATAAD